MFKYTVAADGSVGTAEHFDAGVVSSGDGMVVVDMQVSAVAAATTGS